MARRVSLPSSDDLFRPTAPPVDASGVVATGETNDAAPAKPSGRVKHDEKMTVYVTSAELLAIEQARLALRGEHGVAVDRGRLVREAVALALVDLDERGADSAIARRLLGEQ